MPTILFRFTKIEIQNQAQGSISYCLYYFNVFLYFLKYLNKRLTCAQTLDECIFIALHKGKKNINFL